MSLPTAVRPSAAPPAARTDAPAGRLRRGRGVAAHVTATTVGRVTVHDLTS